MKPPFLRRLFLGPFALLYAGVLHVRHFFFDIGLFKSREGALPTLVLGNLTVGGTGKTPLTERVVLEMEAILGAGAVGVLSRGYGRSTKGFAWVTPMDSASAVGDEPLMLSRKLRHTAVAVCEDRIKGLKRMRDERPDLRWVVCDDAYQHRWLQPTISMLLVDSTQPVSEDALLPLGRLRDLPSRLIHADAVIVTRMEEHAADVRQKFALDLPSNRPVFTTRMQPQSLRCWPSDAKCPNGDAASPPARRERILAVAGIARPERFMDRLAERFQVVRREAFNDHRNFTEKDFDRWKRILDSDRLHAVVTTEKDAMRLPSEGIAGVEVRYEPLEAVWHEPDAMTAWLKKQIETHPD